MKPYRQPEPTILVIFGASGDLTQRKLVPALMNLHIDCLLPDRLALIGTDKRSMTDAKFREHLLRGAAQFSRRGKPGAAQWREFARHLQFHGADLGDLRAYHRLAEQIKALDKKWGLESNHVFYLAIPPGLIQTVVYNLGLAGLGRANHRNRIVVEKPFGRDLSSAKALNRGLTNVFEESQIYRIDHYLGKETVQNILAFRFANSMFEPIWNRRYIDHVQITVAETVGVEHRGAYYERAGALRDMVQNHLMQVLCLIAMEAPVSYRADEIRNKKVDLLQAIRAIPMDQLHQYATRGQYGPGWIRGRRVKAYRAEGDVSPESNIETYAAVKLFVDNWRWQGVPFYLRTGKRMALRASEVVIQFRPVPHQSFPSSAIVEPQPNRLMIRIQPEEGIVQRFQAKLPGEVMRLTPVDMRFSYRDAFHTVPPEAYETLLLDVMLGDPTQFMRADQLEAAWALITPILEGWESTGPQDFSPKGNYASGTWGPEAAEVLIAQDGRSWFLPTVGDGGGGEEEE